MKIRLSSSKSRLSQSQSPGFRLDPKRIQDIRKVLSTTLLKQYADQEMRLVKGTSRERIRKSVSIAAKVGMIDVGRLVMPNPVDPTSGVVTPSTCNRSTDPLSSFSVFVQGVYVG